MLYILLHDLARLCTGRKTQGIVAPPRHRRIDQQYLRRMPPFLKEQNGELVLLPFWAFPSEGVEDHIPASAGRAESHISPGQDTTSCLINSGCRCLRSTTRGAPSYVWHPPQSFMFLATIAFTLQIQNMEAFAFSMPRRMRF
jgi:hypothetical protein